MTLQQIQQEIHRLLDLVEKDSLTQEIFQRGFGEINIKIQNSKAVLIEHNFKKKPQEN